MTARGPGGVLAALSTWGIGYARLTECEYDKFCLEFGGIEKSEEVDVCDLGAMSVTRAEEDGLTCTMTEVVAFMTVHVAISANDHWCWYARVGSVVLMGAFEPIFGMSTAM